MTPEDRKLLTEFLGEDFEFACKVGMDREFINGNDFFALKNRLDEKGLSEEFCIWAWDKDSPHITIDPIRGVSWEQPYIMWYWHTLSPTRFPELVVEFLRGQK